MTKPREPLTYERALTEIASLIGYDRCAAICGVSERTVRKWGEPDVERCVSLVDAERLDRAYLDRGGPHAPFLTTLRARLDLKPCDEADSLHARSAAAGKIAKETGEAVAAMLQARSPAERRQAERELKEAMEACGIGLSTLGESGD